MDEGEELICLEQSPTHSQHGNCSRAAIEKCSCSLCLVPGSSELAEHLQQSKGREGLHGDNIENDMGFEADSSKRGASASRATAATISDARSGVPGMDGEGNYAVSVYIQLRETVAPLVLELTETECPQVWRSSMFVSVCVDDFQMVGGKERLAPKWHTLTRHIELGDRTPLLDKVCWGCTQRAASGASKRVPTYHNLSSI